MYLALVSEKGQSHFVLRHSVKDDKLGWISIDIMDLGPDPEEFVEYIDERIFFISDKVHDAVQKKGIEYTNEDLEEIFWPFVDAHIRQRIDDFGGIRGRAGLRQKRRYSKKELQEMQENIHPFDKRRMIFLKFLQINLEPLMDSPMPFLNNLLNKSRDEIEQTFEFMELELRPWEMKGYLYAIFGLAERFSTRLTRFIPDAQDQELMDDYFIDEICRLNRDFSYLDAGSRPSSFSGIHPYLRRYLIEYFDFAFRQRHFGYTSQSQVTASEFSSEDEYLEIMGLDQVKFNEMDVKSLIRHFRIRAQELHPDKGGDHEEFLRLKEAFEYLLSRKG